MGEIAIYVMTHKKFVQPNCSIYYPLHVGHAISEDLGYLNDDIGENISDKNKSFCEMTGVYWIWKHSKADIIGICHYRRYFFEEDKILDKKQIEDILSNYDCIVGNSSKTQFDNLRQHYAEIHYERDLDICREVVAELEPSYLNAFDICMNCNLFTIGNMMIASKKIMDNYCEWVFMILFEVEKRVDISGYDEFQFRIFGYLAERLLRVWLMNNPYRVREVEVKMIE